MRISSYGKMRLTPGSQFTFDQPAAELIQYATYLITTYNSTTCYKFTMRRLPDTNCLPTIQQHDLIYRLCGESGNGLGCPQLNR